jgi:outer membrane lipoprotein-sorting protein
MKARLLFLFLLLVFFSCPIPPSFSQEPTPQEIVKRCDDLMRGDTQEGKYTMTVITPSWERILTLYVYSQGRDKIFIRILSPSKEKGTTTLRIKSEMWNYLPSVERTIKIPPSMMLEPWMGSDFANDDLFKESSVVNDYTHEILTTEKIDDQDVYKIQLTPKPRAGVIWDKRIMWIRKSDYVPLRDEFYAKNNRLIKTLAYSDVKKISGRLIPTHWEMVSEIKKGRRTTIEVDSQVVYNKPIDDSVFSLQNLKSK